MGKGGRKTYLTWVKTTVIPIWFGITKVATSGKRVMLQMHVFCAIALRFPFYPFKCYQRKYPKYAYTFVEPLCMLGNFSGFCGLLTFFKISFFQKNISGTLSECQTVWIQIRTDLGPYCLQLARKELKSSYLSKCYVYIPLQNVYVNSRLKCIY